MTSDGSNFSTVKAELERAVVLQHVSLIYPFAMKMVSFDFPQIVDLTRKLGTVES